MATANGFLEEQARCTFCNDEAKHYCRTCKENLCLKCYEVHRKNSKMNTNHHHVVPFQQRKESLRSTVPDTCAVHHGTKYEQGCMSCQVAICKKCASGLHNGHKRCDLPTFTNNMIALLTDEHSYIQKDLLPKYCDSLSKPEETPEHYSTTMMEIKHNMTKEIGRVCDLLNYLLLEKHMAVDDVHTLDQELLRVEKENNQNHYMRLMQLEQRYKEFFASVDRNVLIDFLHDRQDFKDLIRGPDCSSMSSPQYQPSNFNPDVLRLNLASVSSANQSPLVQTRLRHFDRRLMAEPVRLGTFTIGKTGCLYQIKCLGIDNVWILTGESTLQLYNSAGKKKEYIETSDGPNGSPAGIAVSELNEVYFTRSLPTNCICVARQGKKPQCACIIMTDEWVPNGICVTTTGELLVTLQKCSDGKVVKYQECTEYMTIQYDDIGHSIYAMPWYIVENPVNNDICVSDTHENLLVVVNKFGKLRFRFDANYRYFQPRDLCVNSQGHILVADPYNNNILILGMDGVFIQSINTRPLDLLLPQAISIDADQNLWIGGRDSRRVVVLKYIHDL